MSGREFANEAGSDRRITRSPAKRFHQTFGVTGKAYQYCDSFPEPEEAGTLHPAFHEPETVCE